MDKEENINIQKALLKLHKTNLDGCNFDTPNYRNTLKKLNQCVIKLCELDPENRDAYIGELEIYTKKVDADVIIPQSNNDNSSNNFNSKSNGINNNNNTNKTNKASLNEKNENDEVAFNAIDIPNISFNDVAGLDEVKQSIKDKILDRFKYQDEYELFNIKKDYGFLLYGLPGTGKTMIAKAIAHEVNAPFYSISCSDILSKWVGDDVKNIKNLFDTARQHEMAVIFFDEFDAIGAKRSDDNRISKNLIPELLKNIQGVEKKQNDNLILLAATNRPWDIDSALLRPGRFGEKIYVTLPDDEARKFIIEKVLKGVPKEDNLDINNIIKITNGFSCADVEAFCEKMKNITLDKLKKLKDQGSTDSYAVKINNDDVVLAQQKVHSSIQQGDIDSLLKFMKDNNESFEHI